MDSNKIEAFQRAAAEGDLEMVKKMLDEGADPNATVNGRSAFHCAVDASQHRFRPKIVETLIAAGADINALNENRCTPLMIACLTGKANGSAMALKLIELGADVKYVRKSDMASAIDFSVIRARPEVLQSLVGHGAPVDGPEDCKITPLMRAVVENNLESVKTLVGLGANLDIQCTLPWANGKTAEQIAEEKKRKAILEYLRNARKERASAG